MREKLTSALFGGSCFVCRGAARALLCGECDAELPRLAGPLCPRCALQSPGGLTCGRCLRQPPAYDATVAALGYEFPADVLVQALKFRGELAVAPLLAAYLAACLAESLRKVDCVIPVPLSRERLQARGFNQSAEIARHVAPRAKLELTLCERTRESPPQMELPYEARQKNVRGAFRCTGNVIGASVALVDDVMTTGATLDELARTLKQAGAVSVTNWVVARTP
jgi:ComF family protein